MLYRVRVSQETVTVGKITSNTLFGAFLTAYSSLYTIDKDMIDDIVLSDGTQRRSEGEKAMKAFNFSQISCSSQRSHQIIRWFVRVRMKSGELMS